MIQAFIAVCCALLLTILGFVLYGWHESSEVARLRADNATAVAQHRNDAAALTAEQSTTATLRAAVAQWAQTCGTAKAAATAAAAQVDRLSSTLSSTRTALAAAEVRSHAALPACAQLLDTDLSAICPDVARRLRALPAANDAVR